MRHSTWEILSSSVRYLATSEESIQERALGAYNYYLFPLKTEEFPEELQEEFENLKKELEAGKQMSISQASKIAERIVSMYDTVACDYCSSYKFNH